MADIRELTAKTLHTLKEEGIISVGRKAKSYVHTARTVGRDAKDRVYKDVLFINGCDESVPHPARYRVTHQREQLAANNISTGEVYYVNLQLDQVRYYRTFVFFRCPYTDMIGEFIKLAKKLNKRVLFDIDDLVVDTKYTDTIKYLDSMSKEERALYDDGVMRMGRTLKLCDAAITTTERLAEELGHYVPEVFINRNTASEEMCALSKEALKNKTRKDDHVGIGYFSGSLTHNDDFELVLPALTKVMEKYPQVQLHVVGELDLPEALQQYKARVVSHPFVDWKKLPSLIAEVDINLAPLEQSIFNEAKSENKWVEAALVKVPTVASNVGAFQRMIVSGKTGILCDTEEEWVEQLSRLVEDKKERDRIAENAHRYCTKKCVTVYTGFPLVKFIKKYTTPNIAFILPSLNISGGIMVALWHAVMLQDAGMDVTLFNVDNSIQWCTFKEHQIPVMSQDLRLVEGRIDKAVATMWTTVAFLENYQNIEKRYYLVQNFETDFYEPGVPLRVFANQSYIPKVPIQYLTISKWCEEWLRDDYEQIARYAPNGIEKENFPHHKREMNGKIRILIEGDCGVEYKNVDESFKITNELDKEKYEIWYMSYNAEPKDWYRVDKFLHKVPFDQVADVYNQCDILLKTSYLESFSYPPLEMMATGGYTVVVPNDGNKEYLVDGENCLLYPLGKIEKGIAAIERICTDKGLQEHLYECGIKTAQSRDWESIRKEIVALYED
ncbi:glycosyltransferase [bacterium 210928-DFI.3.100]|nr:glycosyltransferase [bacterium 210928-DFI.3.100]